MKFLINLTWLAVVAIFTWAHNYQDSPWHYLLILAPFAMLFAGVFAFYTLTGFFQTRSHDKRMAELEAEIARNRELTVIEIEKVRERFRKC